MRAQFHWSVLLGSLFSLLLGTGCSTYGTSSTNLPAKRIATYSIVAFDPNTGDLGVAVQSKFFGVGSVVPWAKANVGAIATQSFANTEYGPQGLQLLEKGKPVEQVVRQLTEPDKYREERQLGIVDAQGHAAAFTGANCKSWAGQHIGSNYTAQGNLLAGEAVVADMATAFEKARAAGDGELADWLLSALVAAEKAGGDKRGRQSAALLVVRAGFGYAGQNDRYIDLRVEDNPQPVDELLRLLRLHKQFYSEAHASPPKREEKK